MYRSLIALLFFVISSAIWPSAQAGELIPLDEVRAIAKVAYIYGYPLQGEYRIMFAFAVYKGGRNTWGRSTPSSMSPAYTRRMTRLCLAELRHSLYIRGPRFARRALRFDRSAGGGQTILLLPDDGSLHLQFKYVGTRATGNKGGKYPIAGPNWKGETPAGIKESSMPKPTWSALSVGRSCSTRRSGNVKKIQARYNVQPLSSFE